MKQLLPLFLFLLPCLAWAQYPSNGNQKISLGEQTTADGLIWRGVAATDTVRKPSIDTMAYMVLDTTTNIMWHYKKATSNAWLRVGGSISSGLTGFLPVANGGTNTSTLTANKVMVGNGTSGVLTPTNLHWNNTLSRLGIGITNPGYRLEVFGNIAVTDTLRTRFTSYDLVHYNNLSGVSDFVNLSQRVYGKESTALLFGDSAKNNAYLVMIPQTSPVGSLNIGNTGNGNINLYTASTLRTRFTNNGEIWMGYSTGQGNYRLQVQDSVYIGGNVSAAAYTTRSDYNLKDDIFNIKYGLNDVLKLQPVEYTYKSNGSKQLGFIAQDIGVILPEVVSFEESMSVNYQAIIPILTKAIQEQNSLIKALEQRIINLENK
jgi:hypothetical protein